MKTIMILAGGVAMAATMSMANPPLRDVPAVSNGLITAGMAIELGDNCEGVSVRLLRGMNFLNSLKATARGLGYSDSEIDAYVGDRSEKARLEGIARLRLSELGVRSDDRGSYCTVARAQIGANTQLGRLLR